MQIKAFEITPDKNIPLDLTAASLDGLTAQLSTGFYTTFSTLAHGTKVLDLKSHLQRLYKPAKEIGLHPPVNERELRERIAELVESNLPNESRVRIILTKDKAQLFIGIQLFEHLPESVYTNGVKVITAETSRHDPRIKDTGFISESVEQRKLLNKDVFEILLTKDGKILEGMTSNFYAIKNKTIITARYGILLGITRKAVLRLARGQGMLIEYRAPKLNEKFDEAFLTSSSRGVVPIISIDEKPVGRGNVRENTKQLSAAYEAYVVRKAESLTIVRLHQKNS